LNVTTGAVLMADCSAAAVQLAGVPLPTTTPPAVPAAATGDQQTVAGAAMALAAAAAQALLRSALRSDEDRRSERDARTVERDVDRCMGAWIAGLSDGGFFGPPLRFSSVLLFHCGVVTRYSPRYPRDTSWSRKIA
jgi:hypothetical protein